MKQDLNICDEKDANIYIYSNSNNNVLQVNKYVVPGIVLGLKNYDCDPEFRHWLLKLWGTEAPLGLTLENDFTKCYF